MSVITTLKKKLTIKPAGEQFRSRRRLPESQYTPEQHQQRNRGFLETYQRISDPQVAFDFCKISAEEGVIEALYLLALMFDKGDGQRHYYHEAAAYYQRAADQKHPASLYNLGLLHLSGELGKSNAVLAFSCFEQAAKLGVVQAQYNLANMLDQGAGCYADKSAAFNWYNTAAEQGYKQAWNNIAVMYYLGEGVDQDKIKAYAWTLLAAKGGVTEAINAEPQMTRELSSIDLLAGKTIFEHLRLGFAQYLPIDVRTEN